MAIIRQPLNLITLQLNHVNHVRESTTFSFRPSIIRLVFTFVFLIIKIAFELGLKFAHKHWQTCTVCRWSFLRRLLDSISQTPVPGSNSYKGDEIKMNQPAPNQLDSITQKKPSRSNMLEWIHPSLPLEYISPI